MTTFRSFGFGGKGSLETQVAGAIAVARAKDEQGRRIHIHPNVAATLRHTDELEFIADRHCPRDQIRFPHENKEDTRDRPAADPADDARNGAPAARAAELPPLWTEVLSRVSGRDASRSARHARAVSRLRDQDAVQRAAREAMR